MNLKKCKTCGFYTSAELKCRLTGQPRNADDFCSKHDFNPAVCASCHSITLKPIIENGNYYCQQCAENLNTCVGCGNASKCEFETNPSPTQKYIRQQIRQGPITSVQTVKHPKRVEEFCHKCECWNNEINDCGRQFNWCTNYKGVLNVI